MTDPAAGSGQPYPAAAEVRPLTAAVRRDRQRVAQPNGWWGMALFLCSEVALFGTMIGSYFYLDFDARRWPPAGIAAPSVPAPVIATAVLVAVTPVVMLAARSARDGRRWSAVRWLTLALVVQCAFLAAQILLFRHDIRQFTPQGSAYGSIYFTLLAAHDAHVLLGILLDVAVLSKLVTGGLDNYWLIGVRGVALYWQVVNALAVVVLLVTLSPSL